jgi:type II secretory pathway pseudopilin PulG
MPKFEAMTEISGPACQRQALRQRAKRTVGTTLIEILVVIVVFLIGILAVVQIFPKGFQILLLNRNKVMAQALARDYVEILKSRPDQLPEQIVSAYYDGNGNLIIDSSKDPNDLGTLGTSLNINGFCNDLNGLPLGSWQFYTASNVFRRVIGEGQRVPAPRTVGTGTKYFGGLMVLQFGPINYHPTTLQAPSNMSVYGNDLEQIVGLPANSIQIPGTTSTLVQRTDYQYFVSSPNNNGIALYLPTGSNADINDNYRLYRVSFSAYLSNGSGGLIKRDYTELTPVKVNGTSLDTTGQYPLTGPVYLTGPQGLVTDPIQSIDLNTLRVQRFFLQLDKNSGSFSSSDPYQYMLINENLGVLLFNPIGNGAFVSREGHDREPLTARVNYDVYDWRILHDDFRIDAGILPGEASSADPQYLSAQHKLPIGSLKVAGLAGPDGLSNTPIPILEVPQSNGTTDTSPANGPGTDNFVLMDLDTGGVFCEVNTANPSQQLIKVNKNTGVVTIYDLDGDPTNGITGELLLPDGTTMSIQMDNRAVRALYMANNEYSVQVLKAASQYTVAPTPVNLGVGQFFIGHSDPSKLLGTSTRIYFPQSDNGRKVTVGEVTYVDNNGVLHDLVGQDFLISPRINDNLGSQPAIDLQDVDPNASYVSFANGIGARGIKGMSVAVRVLWNPTSFHLGPNSATNLSALSTWEQNWRKSTNETFLQKEDNNR